MYALRIQTVIPKSRCIVVSLPDDAPTGVAEVIVLATDRLAGNGHAILQHLRARQWRPTHRRTDREIDQQIQEERNAWE